MTGLVLKTAQILSVLCIHVISIRTSTTGGSTPHCTRTINSVRGACRLTLSNFTMAGAHSAGAGAYGHLDYIPGIRAPDCKTRNQDRSFTNMLQSGVRYLELKVRHRHPVIIQETNIIEGWLLRWPADRKATQKQRSEVSKRAATLPLSTEEMSGEEGAAEKQEQKVRKKRQVPSVSEDKLIHTANKDILSFQDQKDTERREVKKREALPSVADKTLFLYHNGAYSKPLSQALKEIDRWLGSHRDDIVVLRVSNTDDKHDISRQLATELSVISHTGVNEDRNPELGSAVTSNKRIVLFLKQEHYIPHIHADTRVHPIVKLDTTIKLHRNCVETTTLYAKQHRERENHHTIQLDWFHTLGGICNKELAQLCNSREIDRLQQINEVLLRDYHQPVNVILLDYVEKGDEGDKLNHVVQKINEKNVLLYA